MPNFDNRQKRIDGYLEALKKERLQLPAPEVARIAPPDGHVVPPPLPSFAQLGNLTSSRRQAAMHFARTCACDGRLAMARYGADGKYIRSVIPEPGDDQKCVIETGVVSANFNYGWERCPFCFAEGEGAVRCQGGSTGGCGKDVCYGLTTRPTPAYPLGYFRCFCGNEGPLQRSSITGVAIRWMNL